MGLRKARENFNHSSQSLKKELSVHLPEYKAGMLTKELYHLVRKSVGQQL
jgi:hypothetical protein